MMLVFFACLVWLPFINGVPIECIFKQGDGVGGTEVKIGKQKGMECIEACRIRKLTDSAINGVTVFSDTTKGGCWCERNMKGRNDYGKYKSCIMHELQTEIVMGKTDWGLWSGKIMCKKGHWISGFRLRVQPKQGGGDDTALNGIQLLCSDNKPSMAISGYDGVWKGWRKCASVVGQNYGASVTGFNFRSEKSVGPFDDTAGNNVRMICGNGRELDGDGLQGGTWDSGAYRKCPPRTSLCGVQAKVERKRASGDSTGLNKIKFICCKFHEKEAQSIVMGKTDLGMWSEKIICEQGHWISGFRLRVQPKQGSGDDTALNGIQLLCSNNKPTKAISGYVGNWLVWRKCAAVVGQNYGTSVTGFNFRSEKSVGSSDDTAGNNVRMICGNGRELDGGGLQWGTWDSEVYRKCSLHTFPCGVQAQIQRPLDSGDSTGLNKIKFICCKLY